MLIADDKNQGFYSPDSDLIGENFTMNGID